MLYEDAEIEKARKIFSGECKFIAAALNSNAIPPEEGNEVAFAGRSNVGKSSLVNALTNRKTLARTSQTPGRTTDFRKWCKEFVVHHDDDSICDCLVDPRNVRDDFRERTRGSITAVLNASITAALNAAQSLQR